jgi:tetratricopeptide (TPR) repeat protein
VSGEERVEIDSSALLVRGAKEFDWIVTPRIAGDQQVPVVRYPYFDPYAERYELTGSTPLPVHVAPGTLAANDDANRKSALSIRAVNEGPVPAPLPSRAAYWLIVLAAPLPAIAIAIARRPRRVRPLPTPATELREFARAPDGIDARRVRRAFAAAIAERLALRATGAHVASARPGVLTRRLRRCGVTAETAQAVEDHLRVLDAAAYANAGELGVGPAALSKDARALYDRLDAEARTTPALRASADRGPRAAPTVVRALLVVALGAGAVHAARAVAARQAASPFAAGVAAYGQGRYADAARDFARASALEPRSADAWANTGTAAWAAADTVGAAIGWQHALRLQPRADDVRDRLALLPAAQDGWIAGVPPLPMNWVALSGAGLWIFACAAFVLRLLGRGAAWPLGAVAGVAIVAASGAAVIGAQVGRVESGRALAVVRTTGNLHSEPALGAESGPPVQSTDVARILARESVWARVALDGGRDGWIEAERLAPLDGSR